MTGGGPSSGGKKAARIEIIPLIDVIFFLLATFILFTLSLNKITSIPLDLPVAAPPRPQTEPDETSVTLQVSEAGAVYWNREPILFSEVPSRLQSYTSSVPLAQQRVLLASDDRARYGPTVAILDEVRKAGIKQVSIETVYRPTGR